MNAEHLVDLGDRAIRCANFRWLPGMRLLPTGTLHACRIADDGRRDDGCGVVGLEVRAFGPAARLPDLSDPATLGCLLALVREAWGDPGITTLRVDSGHSMNRGRWAAYGDSQRMLSGNCESEAEALVLALVAADLPGRAVKS